VTGPVRQPFFLKVIVPFTLAGAENEIFVRTWKTLGFCWTTPTFLGAAGTRTNTPGGTFICAGTLPVCLISAFPGLGFTGTSSGGNIVPVPTAAPGVWIGSGSPSPICIWCPPAVIE
jgi:hypothetical protein